jgi:ribosomal protein L11 methyltransferase
MDYTELKIDQAGEGEAMAILTADLAAFGFESFAEEPDCLRAYIPLNVLDDTRRAELDTYLTSKNILKYSLDLIPDQNWNALWESNFQAVTISGKCHIRAPFHPSLAGIPYEIVIEPKMAFGTAHHETTALMIEKMLEMDFKGKTVLDMGCGTGILAILANKSGAYEITAIDNDPWAYRNTLENFRINDMGKNLVIHGDVADIRDKMSNIVLANINRNILVRDIKTYSKSLLKNGYLLVSGFYREDIPHITESALSSGLKFLDQKEKNNWICMSFVKE